MSDKPTLKDEIDQEIKLPFGSITIKNNKYGKHEVEIFIDEAHETRFYRIDQRPNNTLYHFKLIIGRNENR